jgi:hypothetical protein
VILCDSKHVNYVKAWNLLIPTKWCGNKQ